MSGPVPTSPNNTFAPPGQTGYLSGAQAMQPRLSPAPANYAYSPNGLLPMAGNPMLPMKTPLIPGAQNAPANYAWGSQGFRPISGNPPLPQGALAGVLNKKPYGT